MPSRRTSFRNCREPLSKSRSCSACKVAQQVPAAANSSPAAPRHFPHRGPPRAAGRLRRRAPPPSPHLGISQSHMPSSTNIQQKSWKVKRRKNTSLEPSCRLYAPRLTSVALRANRLKPSLSHKRARAPRAPAQVQAMISSAHTSYMFFRPLPRPVGSSSHSLFSCTCGLARIAESSQAGRRLLHQVQEVLQSDSPRDLPPSTLSKELLLLSSASWLSALATYGNSRIPQQRCP